MSVLAALAVAWPYLEGKALFFLIYGVFKEDKSYPREWSAKGRVYRKND